MSVETLTTNTIRTYDISFDKNLALETHSTEQFTSYITTQMETHLGERFNVSLSRYEYDIKNGKLWGKDMDKPFVESLKKGRDYRLIHGNAIDRRREDSEVVGFQKIEDLLADENIPDGTMMLSISPPGLQGSTYTHNFYDIFVVRSRNNGKRYVETRRYASSLSPYEYMEKISAFTNIKIDKADVAASFLENPISIQNTLTPEDLHLYMHKEHEFMEEEEFEQIKKGCQALIKAYSESLFEQPQNDLLHKTLFNVILNKADELAANKTKTFFPTSVGKDVEKYAFLPVREVMTGCGISGGYATGLEQMNSPFSLSAFIPDKYGEREFNCPSCKKENIRPYNKLLLHCLHCGSDKVSC